MTTLLYVYMIKISHRIPFELGDYANAFSNNGNKKNQCLHEEGKKKSPNLNGGSKSIIDIWHLWS